MDAALRQVTRMPLGELWDEHGAFGQRIVDLTRDGVRAVVSKGPIRFVEVVVGDPLLWIHAAECFRHWKAVAPNIAEAAEFCLEDFPGEFVFVASEWKGRAGERLIVLEKHH